MAVMMLVRPAGLWPAARWANDPTTRGRDVAATVLELRG
jgi:hypothetical protein